MVLSDTTLIFKLEIHVSIINGSVFLHPISNLKSEIAWPSRAKSMELSDGTPDFQLKSTVARLRRSRG